MAAGTSVRIDADVWAGAPFALNALDLWVAPDAENPRWAWIATLVPDQAGGQTLSTTLTLPRGGTVEAIRGVFRNGGDPAACGGHGFYDDRDDLLIQVAQVPDTAPPSVAFTSPSGPYIGGRVLLAVDASDDVAVNQVSFFDGTDLLLTLFQPPWELTWDTAALRVGGPPTRPSWTRLTTLTPNRSGAVTLSASFALPLDRRRAAGHPGPAPEGRGGGGVPDRQPERPRRSGLRGGLTDRKPWSPRRTESSSSGSTQGLLSTFCG